MDCKSAREKLAFFDSVSEFNSDKNLQDHLLTCSACQIELNRLKTAWDFMSQLPSLQPSPDFRSRFWKKVQTEQSVSIWAFPKLIPALVGFMSLWIVGIILGVMLYSTSHREQLSINNSVDWQTSVQNISLEKAFFKEERGGRL